jgi:hypothetical protein
MRKSASFLTGLAIIGGLVMSAATPRADDGRASECRDVPSHSALRNALEAAPSSTGTVWCARSRSRATTVEISGPAAE